MSGNRTRGVCVTGRNVTNYTNTDLFLFQNLKHWIRPLMFEFQRVRCCNRDNDSSFDHTMVDTPHPIRTAKLSTIGPNQYCGGGPRGNLGCRMFFFFFFSPEKNKRMRPIFFPQTFPITPSVSRPCRTHLPTEGKKKQTGKPRLNLTRSLQQGNSR